MRGNAFLTVVLLLVFTASGHAVVVEKIIAVVNERVITLSDLEDEAVVRRQLGEAVDKGKLLGSVIEREIVAREAGRLGIVVPQDEVAGRLLRFEGTFPSKEDFDRFLKRYELNIQDLSGIFSMSITVEKVRQLKDSVSSGRYDKWLDEAQKKADIKIISAE